MFIHARHGALRLPHLAPAKKDPEILSQQWVLGAHAHSAQPTYGFMNWFPQYRPEVPAERAGQRLCDIGNGTNAIYVIRSTIWSRSGLIDTKAMDEFSGRWPPWRGNSVPQPIVPTHRLAHRRRTHARGRQRGPDPGRATWRSAAIVSVMRTTRGAGHRHRCAARTCWWGDSVHAVRRRQYLRRDFLQHVGYIGMCGHGDRPGRHTFTRPRATGRSSDRDVGRHRHRDLARRRHGDRRQRSILPARDEGEREHPGSRRRAWRRRGAATGSFCAATMACARSALASFPHSRCACATLTTRRPGLAARKSTASRSSARGRSRNDARNFVPASAAPTTARLAAPAPAQNSHAAADGKLEPGALGARKA